MRKLTRPRTIFGPLHVVTTKEGNWEINLEVGGRITRWTTLSRSKKCDSALKVAKRFIRQYAIDGATKRTIRVFIAFHDVKEEKSCE